MTKQFDDIFKYRDEWFSVVGISEGDLFDPVMFGLKPVASCTACHRGYQAVYTIIDGNLIFDDLHVELYKVDKKMKKPGYIWPYVEVIGPEINGVKPVGKRSEHDFFNNHYINLRYHIVYTGGILIADQFIDELNSRMGFQKAWKYKEVVELIFKKGILRKEIDRSKHFAEIRKQKIKNREKKFNGELNFNFLKRYVRIAFDRRYERGDGMEVWYEK